MSKKEAISAEDPSDELPDPQDDANDDAPSGSPPGMVQLTAEEHNRLQAEARAAKKRAKRLEDEKAEREREDRQKAAKAAGDFDSALREEREERDRLARELRERDVRDAVREQISTLGLAGDKARGLLRLVDLNAVAVDDDGAPDPTSVEAAVGAAMDQFPSLFQVKGNPDPDDDKEQRPMRRRTPGPSAPPEAARDHKPSDYVSPEEYVNTPHAVRLSDEFQARVRKSRPHWPTKVPSSTFSIEG